MSPYYTSIGFIAMWISVILAGAWPGPGADGHLLQGGNIIYYNDGHELDGSGERQYVVYQAEMDVGGNCHHSSAVFQEHQRPDPGPVLTIQPAIQTTTCMSEVIVWYPADGVEINPISNKPFRESGACPTTDPDYDCQEDEATAIAGP